MYRLRPCIPIFRLLLLLLLLLLLFLLFFFIKSAKRVCICDYVKSRIGTCKKCVFQFKKGYKRIIALGNPKTYCYFGKELHVGS